MFQGIVEAVRSVTGAVTDVLDWQYERTEKKKAEKARKKDIREATREARVLKRIGQILRFLIMNGLALVLFFGYVVVPSTMVFLSKQMDANYVQADLDRRWGTDEVAIKFVWIFLIASLAIWFVYSSYKNYMEAKKEAK